MRRFRFFLFLHFVLPTFFRLSGNFSSQFCILFYSISSSLSMILRLCRLSLVWSLLVYGILVVGGAHLHCRQFVCSFVLHYSQTTQEEAERERGEREGERHRHATAKVCSVCRLTILLTLSYSGSSTRQMWAESERQVINEWIVRLDSGIKMECPTCCAYGTCMCRYCVLIYPPNTPT